MQTDYSSRCNILAQVWMDYRHNEDFQDFVAYNDLGLPLAYAIAEGIVSTAPQAEIYINETFDLLLGAMELEDEGFDSLEDLLTRYSG